MVNSTSQSRNGSIDNQEHSRNSSIGSSISVSASESNPSTPDPNNKLAKPTSTATDSPLTTIANKLPYLTESQQEPIRRTLDLISNSTPIEISATPLLLAHSWTLFFSDTSVSKSTTTRGHHHHHHSRPGDHTSLLKAAEYQSGMSQVFTGIGDVESLCASLTGFKKTVADSIRKGNLIAPPTPTQTTTINSPNLRKNFVVNEADHVSTTTSTSNLEDNLVVPGNGLGLIAMKPGHNLHFFRVGVNPVWEDPWNSKGGSLKIITPLSTLDPTFESIVLLIAGGVLEADANTRKLNNPSKKPIQETDEGGAGGRVVGVVGSRRRNGDRIEIWLSGPTIGTAPNEEWIKSIHNVLILEIGSSEIRAARYKKHL
ncbi:hypothetical protein Pst134EB_027399 [Puccinia striiformis f. sp. tritici]|nr:hypothetical protein Pst134EB_027399 [Puccinia striiformis f. sp. tritici]